MPVLQRLAILTTLLSSAGVVCGQAANCALRAPDTRIYEIFPEATNYKTFEARVGDSIAPEIERRLGSPLIRTDTGTHTVHLVYRGEVPIGIVHARVEPGGNRGSVEFV